MCPTFNLRLTFTSTCCSGSPPSSPECCKSLLAPLWENLSELTDNLILTSAANVSEQTLKTLNISCIICCAPELPDSPLIRDQVIYHKIHVRDSWDSKIFQHFDDTADLIQHVSSLGGRTLVFCVAGVSRSATICIAYLMKHHKLTLLNAYNFAKLRRPKIRPNSGFFRQLIEYEKELFNCNTVHMIYNEFVHMEIPDVYDRDYKTVINQHKKRYNGRR